MGVRDDRRRLLAAGSGFSAEIASQALLYRFYYQMYFIRQFEEQCLLPYARFPLSNSSQVSRGLEACDVGVINALDSTQDFIFSTYRAHSHFIAYYDDISGFIGINRSLADSCCNSQVVRRFHMCARGDEGNLLRKALDTALACKRQRTGAISAVFLDREMVRWGGMQEIGHVSSLWSLPLLFVLATGGTVQCAGRRKGQGYVDTVNAFGKASQGIVADDVFKIYAFASAAVAYVRNNCRPFLLTLQTNCTKGSQDGERVRADDKNDEHLSKDPFHKLARQLAPQARVHIESFVLERIREAVKAE